MPKKPLTAFMCFYQQLAPEINKKVAGIRLPELSKMVGQKWSELSEDLKKPYNDLAGQLKAVYERQHAEWLAKGVF